MRILSGIQPTGTMHLGNYLGAVRQWIELQEKNECFFPIVDLHALTVPQDPKEFKRSVLEKTTELLSVGIDPEKCVLFVQSHIPEHTELAWILNTLTPIAELERMTQFKDKSQKQKSNINAGLLTYPILMAADILLYKTEGVPVGEDQTQHIELTRTLARKFNAKYGETFVIPKAITLKEGARIMSLTNPKTKMSKTDDKTSSISLFDDPKEITAKIATAVTDTGNAVTYNPAKKPGISNLLTIYSEFSGESTSQLEKKFKGKGYAAFKKSLAELLVRKLAPFREKKKDLEKREVYVEEILKKGAQKAQSVASTTMEEVRNKVGLL